MKKLLNISVIAALAVLPVAANAAVGEVVSVADPAHSTASGITAETEPKYALAVEAATDATNVATASYVKGAYNAAMKAINKVAETADGAVQNVSEGSTNGTVSVDGTDVAVHGLGSAAYTDSAAYATAAQGTAAETATTNIGTMANLTTTEKGSLVGAINELKTTADGAVQDVSEGSANGTVSVDGTDVAVHGLGSAAYSDTTAFDAAGAASNVQTAIEGKLDDGATGYDIDAKTLKVQGQNVLTNAALTDYAKKTGVTQTITNSTIAGTVPTVTTWGAETTGTAEITASITGASYTEPANP